MADRVGVMIAYKFRGETIRALSKFSDSRLVDCVARSLKARLGCDIDLWFARADHEADTYTAKWFDGEVWHEEPVLLPDASYEIRFNRAHLAARQWDREWTAMHVKPSGLPD